MSNDDILFKARFEGAPDVVAGVSQVRQAIESLNSDQASLPSGSPSYVPRPPAPAPPTFSQGYASVPGAAAPEPYAASYGAPSSYSPYPSMPGMVGPAPGAFAPPPPGTQRMSDGFAPIPGANVGGGNGMVLNVGTVTINAQVVNLTGNIMMSGEGGGASGGGFSGGGGGASGGGSSPGSGAPPPPGMPGGGGGGGGGTPFNFQPGNNPVPGGGGGTFNLPPMLQQLLQNLPGGNTFMHLAQNGIPIGAAGLAGGAAMVGYAAEQAGSAYISATQPRYDAETALMVAKAQGDYIPEITREGMRKVGDVKGLYNALQFTEDMVGLPKPAKDWLNRDVERGIDVLQANYTLAQKRVHTLAPLGLNADAGSDETFGFRSGLSHLGLPFGTSAGRAGLRHDFGNLGDKYTSEDILALPGMISGFGQSPAYSGLRKNLMGGEDPLSTNNVNAALDILAEQGNLAGIAKAAPYASPERLKAARERAGTFLGIQEQTSIIGAHEQTAAANVQTLGVTGAGYKQIVSGMESQRGLIRQQIAVLQQQLQLTTTPAIREGLQAQIDTLHGQEAGYPSAEAGVEYGQRNLALGARTSGAQTGFDRMLYAGGDEHTLAGGFKSRRSAMEHQVGLLREQARRSDIYSSAERESMSAQANQLEFQATTGIAREQASTSMQIAQGRADITGAHASAAMTNATLFGGSQEVRDAGREQVNSLKESLKAIEDRIRAGNLSLTELQNLQKQGIHLQEQLVQVQTQVARQAAQQDVDVARGQMGIAQQQQGRAALLGQGGMAGFDVASGIVDKAGGVLSTAQAKVDLLKSQGVADNNPEMVAAQAQLEGAKTGQSQSILGLGQVQQPLALTQAEKRGEFQLGMLSRTYASYGNIRGTIGGLMGNVGKELQNINQMEQKAEKEGRFNGPEGEKLRAEFEDRKMEAGNRAIGYQQQLENGWQDRLISSVVNAPGSFGYAASAFTRHEAAGFMGAMSPAFGFTNTHDRDNFMFRGPRIANSLIGNITRPEGFAETAMSGHVDRGGHGGGFFGVPSGTVSAPGHATPKGQESYIFNPKTGKTERAYFPGEQMPHAQPYHGLGHPDAIPHAMPMMMGPGVQRATLVGGHGMGGPLGPMPHTGMRQGGGGNEIVVRVIVQNQQGNTLANQTKTMHDLGNGALNFTVNPHTQGFPHQ